MYIVVNHRQNKGKEKKILHKEDQDFSTYVRKGGWRRDTRDQEQRSRIRKGKQEGTRRKLNGEFRLCEWCSTTIYKREYMTGKGISASKKKAGIFETETE